MRLGRDPAIKPYQGAIRLDSASRTWSIIVRGWDGGPSITLTAADLFDPEMLRAHLILANLSPGNVSFGRRDECRVNLTDSIGANAEAGKLLKILRDHYNHFKGRPIHWMRLAGGPR